MNGSDFLVDVLKDNLLWESFADIAKETYDSKLGVPLLELENLRNISQTTDPVLVERALRQAGLNLSNEFFELNRDKLTRSYHELIKFWEINGTPKYTKFIEFLLGRSFLEDTLYTVDYSDFSTVPGTMITDGGEWYSTSHVDLSVEADGLRESLNLRLAQSDVKSVRTVLGYDSADQDTKDQINEQIRLLQIRELDLENDDPRIIKVLTENRILATYYQFAPIEKVVRDIYLTIQTLGSLSIFASSMIPKRIYYDSSVNVVVGYDFRIPQKIQGFKEYVANVLINWSETTRQDPELYPMSIGQDTLQSEIYPSSVDDLGTGHVQSFDGRTIVFNDVDEITTITLEIKAQGKTWRTTRELYPIGIPFAPDELIVSGPVNPLEEGKNFYTLIAKTDNIREPAEDSRTTWSTSSTVAAFVDNQLVVDEIFEDQEAIVYAHYRNLDSTITTTEFPIVVTHALKDRTAKNIGITLYKYVESTGEYIEIDPLTEIEQGAQKYYASATVYYNDDTEMSLHSKVTESQGISDAPLGIWESSTSKITLDEDILIVSPIMFRDYGATLTVYYTDNDRSLTGTLDLFFKKPRVFIESINILGASSVIEETRNIYQLQATWNTGAITIISPDWGSSVSAGATSAKVTSTGILFAPTVDKDTETVNVTASTSAYRYDEDDNETIVTLKTSKQVVVKPVDRAVQRLDVQTINSIRQGNTNLMRFYAQWNDGTVTEVIPHRIEILKDEEVISSWVKTEQGGSFNHAEGNPVILGLSSDQEFYAKEDDTDHARFQVDYLLADGTSTLNSFNGLVDINIYYIDPLTYTDQVLDDAGLEQAQADPSVILNTSNIRISAVPKIFLSESISIVYPEYMKESSRAFLTALVTYENGDIEEAEADWTIDTLYEEQEIEADISFGTFSMATIINSLLSVDRRWFDANVLTETQINKLIEGELVFQTLSSNAPANWTTSIRELMDNHTVAAQVEEHLGLGLDWLESNTLDSVQATTLKFEVDKYIALAETRPSITDLELTQQVIQDLTDYPNEIVYQRALLQTRPLEDDTEQQFVVTARFFQQEESVYITNIANTSPVITEVLSSRIEGPGEITADTDIFFSYGLVTDLDDVGPSYMSSSGWRVEVKNKRVVLALLENGDATYRSLLPTRADLSVIEVVDLTDEQLEEVFTNVSVAEIDTNGYLYPRINVPAQLIVYADYDDSVTVFTKTMEVYMKETATILTSMSIYNINNTGDFLRSSNVTVSDTSGANDVILLSDVPGVTDVPDGFQRIDSDTGALIYTFKAQLTRSDSLADENGFFSPSVVEWDLDTVSDKIYLGSQSRDTVTVIVNPVETDTQVIINGLYTEEFSRSEVEDENSLLSDQDRIETKTASLRFIIESSTAIETISYLGSTTIFDDVGTFTPSASIQRRDGSLVSDPESILTWYIVAGPSSLAQVSDNTFSIPTLSNNTTMTLRAFAQEGTRKIQEDFVFDLQLAFQPQSIELILPQTNQTSILDSSILELESSILDLDGNPNNVTDRTYFYFNYNESIASLDDNILTVASIEEDTIITVTVKSMDYLTLDAQNKELMVYSTFPMSGTAEFGVTNTSVFNQQVPEWTRLFNRSGGTFEVDPDSDEFGYFAHPKSLGIASFTHIPEVNSSVVNFGGWDGANRPSDGSGTETGPLLVTRTYDQDLTEEWYLYRTNLRGFARGKFAVSYSPE